MPDLNKVLIETEKIVNEIGIPNRPQALIDINAEMKKSQPNFDALSSHVETDINLIVTVLRLANSPFFGLRHKVETVKRALTVLGLNNFKNIVLASCMKNAFIQDFITQNQFELFYNHSVLVAEISKFIAQNINKDTERNSIQDYAYMVGIFHDCGILIMAKKFPSYYKGLWVVR